MHVTLGFNMISTVALYEKRDSKNSLFGRLAFHHKEILNTGDFMLCFMLFQESLHVCGMKSEGYFSDIISRGFSGLSSPIH